jgi:hypothetical protein
MAAPRLVLTTVCQVGLVAGALALAGCTFESSGAPVDAGSADGGEAADAALPIADGAIDASVAPVSGPVLAGLAPAELGNQAAALVWTRRASAPEVFFTAYLPIYQADQLLLDGETCPVIVDSGTMRTYTGNCTTSKGDVWSGNATVLGVVVSGIPGSVSYAGFGHTAVTMCGSATLTTEQLYTGTVVRGSALPALPIVVDVDVRDQRLSAACASEVVHTGIDYHMTVDSGGDGNNDGTPDTRTWNGAGRLGDTSGASTGLVGASTAAEVTGQACSKEALGGSTTMRAGGHTIVVGYDGATDCSPDSTVTWSLDGAPQGELSGVFCSLRPPGRRGGGTSGTGAALLLGAALVVAERRRRGRGDARR